jgi:hypothetical protein
LAGGGAAIAYAAYVHQSNLSASPIVPGWQELIPCSSAVSIDGRKELRLSEDHHAMLHEKSLLKNGKQSEEKEVTGLWSFDDQSRRYSVSTSGTTVSYTLVSPEQVGTCMLINGDLKSANLLESWFSTETDDDPGDYYDREPEVRD